MSKELTYEEIVTIGLQCLQKIINAYDTFNPQVFFRSHINYEGRGPVFTVAFSFSQWSDNPTQVDIELWFNPDSYNQFVLIYMAMDTNTDIDHQTLRLANFEDAYTYFEKGIQLFGLNKLE